MVKPDFSSNAEVAAPRWLAALGIAFWIGSYVIARLFCKPLVFDSILVLPGIPLLIFLWARAWKRSGALVSDTLVRFTSLRTKFLATIALITLLTAGIIFYSFSALETRDKTTRIEQQSVIFTRFSTERLVSNFVGNYERAYLDHFLPGVRELVASDEDLVALRIISARTRNVLFDSETAQQPERQSEKPNDVEKARYPHEIEEQLLSGDLVSREVVRGDERFFDVINTFRSEHGEALFLVDYTFSYRSLERSLQAIRRQILLDLGPAVGLGFLVALVFAQLLISPIRKLRTALGHVTSGDYTARVAVESRDEIGELAAAFNIMTDELRRKKELRKYLSNSSYQQIMRASESGDGARIGGKRVQATILFSDIRGFVSLCETMDAEEVTSMLNEYFSEMVEVIHRQGGEVDKFIGDAILAVFYAEDEQGLFPGKTGALPPSEPRYPAGSGATLQAIYCALGMKARLAEFNLRRAQAGKVQLEIGIGISHGEIISGPIGSDDRLDFTVIGDVVNIANRVEKLSKRGRHSRILFANSVESRVRGLLDYEEIVVEGGIRGKTEEVRVYELVGIKDIETLRTHLRQTGLENGSLRVRSVELLGQSGNEGAIEILIGSLEDPEEAVRVACAQALARISPIDDPRVLDPVFARLREEKSFRALSALIACVGRLCRTDRILGLRPFLWHQGSEVGRDDRIVANAIEALGQARLPRGTDLILPFLNSPSNRIKANAAMAVFAAGHIEVIDTLKPMLMHSEAMMRSSAAFAIGELTLIADLEAVVAELRLNGARMRFYLAELQDCVPMLVSLLRDSDDRVRRQAIIALGKIKDKSSVLPMVELLELKEDGKAADPFTRDILEALRAIGSHKIIRETLAKLS
jgi:class 3 adenylate cyclase/HEAT repeat protein